MSPSEQVMKNTLWAGRLRIGSVLREYLLRRFDQHLDVLRFETEVRIQRFADKAKELPYCPVALIMGGDTNRM